MKSTVVQSQQLLSRYTTLGVGGPAKQFLEVTGCKELMDTVLPSRLNGQPVVWIGHGSNILVHDRGFSGLVVRLGHEFAKFEVAPTYLAVEAGASLARVVRFCCEQSLLDLSCCAGIPGSCGGAVYMNAGTKSGEISEKIAWIELLNPNMGNLECRSPQEMGFAYRTSILQQEPRIVTRVGFYREEGDGKLWWEKARAQIARRKKLQPQGVHNAGSFFRNPPGQIAGVLIEQANLKGTRVGDAMVSPVHGNFLVNVGHATSDDFVQLIRSVRKRVFEKFGVRLALEICLLGFSQDEATELRG